MGEIYTKRNEDVPLLSVSATLEALQRHLDHLQQDKVVIKPNGLAATAAVPCVDKPVQVVPQELHPSARAVLQSMLANPGLDMLQQMVKDRPATFYQLSKAFSNKMQQQ